MTHTDFVSIHLGGGYESDLTRGEGQTSQLYKEYGSKPPQQTQTAPTKPQFRDFKDNELRRNTAIEMKSMNAYDRHKKYVKDYVLFYGKEQDLKTNKNFKTDYDVLKEEYRFIRSEEDNDETVEEKRMAKKYYDRLFKEYCLADLSRYKSGQVGLRWRTEQELFAGKGQFICGNKACNEANGLVSYELPFAYKEAGEKKKALVKCRVCSSCAHKLNYKQEKKKARKRKRELQDSHKLKKRRKLDTNSNNKRVDQPNEHNDKSKVDNEELFQGLFP